MWSLLGWAVERDGNERTRWSDRLAIAALFALAHGGVLVLLQCESYVRFLGPAEGGAGGLLAFLGTLPLLQSENALAAVLMGLGAFAAAGRPALGPGYLIVFAVVTAYLLGDQIYYKLFFDHFRFSTEGVDAGAISTALGSLASELDLVFCANAVLAAGTIVYLGRRLVRPSVRPAWRPRAPVGALMLLALMGVAGLAGRGYKNLESHPLVALIGDVVSSAPVDIVAVPAVTDLETIEPRPPLTVSDPRLPEIAAASRAKRRNVVLVVLESVGSLQLLDGDGIPRERIAPTIARLTRHGVILDSVYAVFPGTVRSHVALNTGGRNLTWGSVYRELSYPYDGPTLARAFARLGYATALFSSATLHGENMDGLMAHMGYRTLYDFGQDHASQVPTSMIHSWGAREEHTLARIEQWIEGSAAARRPFFLTYLTVATHHPYGVPPGYVGPEPGDDRAARYRNALHYTDHALARLLGFLAARRLRDDTIVAIIGDHGEAFGEWHRRNFTHKSFLYEENLKGFLILANPRLIGERIVSHQVGSIGDVMPTLLSLVDSAPLDVPGRSLVAPTYRSRPVFFYKNSAPAQWGLRDGRWKFIAPLRAGQPELYDLAADPTEQRNVIARHSDLQRRYTALVRQWFLAANADFVARLRGHHYVGGRALSTADLRRPGPKILVVGRITGNDPAIDFDATSVFPAFERPVAWTSWIDYPEDKAIRYQWVSPSGRETSFMYVVHGGWITTRVPYPGLTPLEPGGWRLTLWDGRAPLLSTRFTVRAAGSRRLGESDAPVSPSARLVRMAGGTVSASWWGSARLWRWISPALTYFLSHEPRQEGLRTPRAAAGPDSPGRARTAGIDLPREETGEDVMGMTETRARIVRRRQ